VTPRPAGEITIASPTITLGNVTGENVVIDGGLIKTT
jgi:hypothetical protein